MTHQPDDQAAEHTAQQVDDAQTAYAAYGATTGGLNFRGEPMPDWDGLGDTIQRAWIAAAAAVRRKPALEAAGRPLAKGRHELLCEWFLANGLDLLDIPTDAKFEIHDGQLTVDVVMRDENGHTISAGSGRNSTLRTKRSVPLVAPFPGSAG